MKTLLLLFIINIITLCNLKSQDNQKYIFFLHNRFLEENALTDEHPDYGRAEYSEIIHAFKKANFKVISEKRNKDVNAKEYAQKVKLQIDSLISLGVAPNLITVIGTSKGGYIAQYVSTLAANPELNFVFIGAFMDIDIERMPEINFCGNILTIYEETDPFGVSAIRRKETSKLKVNRFKEIQLNTGLNHGFLFKPLEEWINPSISWAYGNYD